MWDAFDRLLARIGYAWNLLRSLPRLILVVLAALSGYLFGVWSTCDGDTCSWSTPMFEAVGTWLGGIGTIVAVLYAARQFRALQDVAAQENRAIAAELEQVTISGFWRESGRTLGFAYYASVVVRNESRLTLSGLTIHYEHSDSVKTIGLLLPGGRTSQVDWRTDLPGLPSQEIADLDERKRMAEKEKRDLTNQIYIRFLVDGEAWERKGEAQPRLASDQHRS